jgi:hypothetical protein
MAHVFLAPSMELAKSLPQPTASVEAEYGSTVIEGRLYTLAHHVNIHNPAPCLFTNLEHPLNENDIILVSHIDADTIGGCLALMGLKPKDDEFWSAVAFIDVNGSHNEYMLNKRQQSMLNALWAWNYIKPKKSFISDGICEVTSEILDYINVIDKIIAEDANIIEAGRVWYSEISDAIESCLYLETEEVRCFITRGVNCSASYYSKSKNKALRATVVLNIKNSSIIIAFADGGEKFSAVDIVKSLWGSEAGGKPGIAGTPRGWSISDFILMNEFKRAIATVRKLFE